MARLPRDSHIETREARRRLKARKEPYWRQIHTGLSVGVYRGKNSSAWYLRRKRDPAENGSGRWKIERIGLVDDHTEADGKKILSYAQAVKRAQIWSGLTGAERDAEINQDEYTVAKCIGEYLEWRRAAGADTYSQRLNFKNHILPKLGHRAVPSLKRQELERWRDGLTKGRSRATVNRVMTDFKSALNKAKRSKRVTSDDEWRDLQKFKNTSNPRLMYLQAKEAKRLLNACPPALRDLARAALLTGGRYGELAKVQVRDFNPDSGTLFFAETKSRKPRHVPLTDEACEHFSIFTAGKKSGDLIFTHHGGKAWGRAHQQIPMRRACEAARIDPPVSFHILRHTYGSLLALKGVPLKFIAEAMGHADTRMTEQHYAHLQRDDAVAKAIRANLPSFGKADSKVRAL